MDRMSHLRTWISSLTDARYVPLFDVDDRLTVRTEDRSRGRRLLRRSRDMEQAVVRVVSEGLSDPSWRGVLYIMAWGDRDTLRPLYIGKAGRFGKTPGKLSANLVNVASDKGKFARWGDGNAYHIGDLSQALFGGAAGKPTAQKYERWADRLFADRESARLREATFLLIVPWREGQRGPSGDPATLEEAESQAIDQAIEEFEDIVLNVHGERWWAPVPGSEPAGSGDAPAPRYELIANATELARLGQSLPAEPILGLDVETTLYTQKLCLVQIATRRRTLLIDPLAVPTLEPLRSVLGARGPLKVIHNASFERRILAEEGLDLGNVFDTLRVSRALGPTKASHRLEAVCARHLGRTLDKSQQLSDWHRRPLSRNQLAYAATDVAVLLDLHDRLAPRVRQKHLF